MASKFADINRNSKLRKSADTVTDNLRCIVSGCEVIMAEEIDLKPDIYPEELVEAVAKIHSVASNFLVAGMPPRK